MQLAIDLKMQQYAEQILEAGLKEARARTPKDKPGVYFKAPAGSLVVEDPRNGEILAMASNPPFDNRFFVGGVSQAKYEELFGDTSGNPQVNRAIQGQYQLGSTMKLFTTMVAVSIASSTTSWFLGPTMSTPSRWAVSRSAGFVARYA